MRSWRVDLPEVALGLEHAAKKVAAMLDDLEDTEAPIPGSIWSVGDAAAHIAMATWFYGDVARGRATSPFGHLDDFFSQHVDERGRSTRLPRSPMNARLLAEFPERAGPPLARRILEETRSFLDAVGGLAEDTTLPWHFGTLVPVGPVAAILLGHTLVHGYDIARALRTRYEIDRTHAGLGIEGMLMVAPLFLSRERAAGLTATIEVRIRGGSTLAFVFSGGDVEISPGGGKADCHLSADPVALLLVANGRLDQWGQIARGRLVAWGRRPWLALRLTALFPSP